MDIPLSAVGQNGQPMGSYTTPASLVISGRELIWSAACVVALDAGTRADGTSGKIQSGDARRTPKSPSLLVHGGQRSPHLPRHLRRICLHPQPLGAAVEDHGAVGPGGEESGMDV